MPPIDRVFRNKGKKPRPRPNPGPGRRLISWPGDFTYLGAFRVRWPIDGSIGADPYFGRGLTQRTDNGNFLSTYAGNYSQRFGIYEFPNATPIVGSGYDPAQYNISDLVKEYRRKVYTNAAGQDMAMTGDISGDNGLGWDDVENVVVWTYSEGYDGNIGASGYATLSPGTGIQGEAVGYGRYTASGQGFKSQSGGMVMIPSSYANAYLSGKRWAFGFGRTQSIITAQDQSMGLSLTAVESYVGKTGRSLRLGDLATSGAGATTVTSATGGFYAGMVGDVVHIVGGVGSTGFITSGFSPYTVTAFNSSTSITLNTSPTASAAGTLGILHEEGEPYASTPLVGYWPTVNAPAAGYGRMNRPDGESLVDQGLDDWPLNKLTWVDVTNSCAWIDTPTRYGVLFGGRYARDIASYLSSDVVATYYSHFVGVYDPYSFTPVSSTLRYELQPNYLSNMQWPVVDYSPYGLGTQKSVSSITSNSSKRVNEADGAIVNCTGHGFTESSKVRIQGASVAQYNSFWDVNLIDANSFYIQNTSPTDFWTGTTANNGGITVASLGQNGIVEQKGFVFDHSTNKLYVLQEVSYSSSLYLIMMVYQLN